MARRGRPKLEKTVKETAIQTATSTEEKKIIETTLPKENSLKNEKELDLLDDCLIWAEKAQNSLEKGAIHFTIGKEREAYGLRVKPNVTLIKKIMQNLSIVIDSLSK